jgi:hypothetical protein
MPGEDVPERVAAGVAVRLRVGSRADTEPVADDDDDAAVCPNGTTSYPSGRPLARLAGAESGSFWRASAR